MQNLERAQKLIAAFAAVAVVASVLLALAVPVYTDEVAWRIYNRAGIDGIDKMLIEVCGPNTMAAPPLFMLPVRAYSAIFNLGFADPFFVRLSGVAYALLFLVLVWRLLRAETGTHGWAVAGIAFSLLGLGLLPLLLVWSRPEQPILLATVAALLVARKGWFGASTPRQTLLRSIAIGLLAVIALSYHPKALVLVPVFAVCIWTCGKSAPRLRAGTLVVLALVVAVSAQYWGNRLSCPNDNQVAALHGKENVGAALSAGSEVRALAVEMARNSAITGYARHLAPAPKVMASWLPDKAVTWRASTAWTQVLALVWTLVQVCSLGLLLRGGMLAIRIRTVEPRLLVTAVLVVATVGWAASQSNKNAYEAAFVMPLLVLAIGFGIASADLSARARFWLTPLLALFALGSLTSQVLVWQAYGSLLAASAEKPGYISGQTHSAALAGYAAERQTIMATARSCGIGTGSSRIMIDDTTYFTMMRNPLPQHHYSVLALDDPLGYLRSIGSGGVIVGCHFLTPELRAMAKQNGSYCCIGAF